MLVDREAAERDTKRLTTRLKFAALRQSACVEDVDLRTPRGIDRAVFARLVGVGLLAPSVTKLAATIARSSIIASRACSRRSPSLEATAAMARLLKTIGRVQLLILDDWGLSVLNPPERRDLLELLDDRHGRASTIVTSQIPVEHWHDIIGEPTLS